jgi:hypothetical protein
LAAGATAIAATSARNARWRNFMWILLDVN